MRSQTMIHQRVVGRRKWPQFLVLLLFPLPLNITKLGAADPVEPAEPQQIQQNQSRFSRT